MASSPDAIFIAAGGASATVPHTELKRLGYKGQIDHTHAAANQAFLRMGGKALDGAVLPVGPVLVWDQLPESHPSKRKARDFSKAYERGMGPDSVSVFGTYLYDAMQLIAASTPNALSSARPGSVEFRKALRAALESSGRVVGAHGIYEFSPESHVSSEEHIESW
ncbi:ABC transporter substrate-binding protein [Pseudomonas sp. D8002]|uniref:ABC transporter substrate-binding protein n=1 Tax=unclassified Pseudomonas TaxID=196821 RepID=UPI00159FA04A|nr:ABC transporter substrate-binding protein [Pseudomonas sp. D8002]NWB20992.1 ABC transporter substrate-binding protein [Pseudomonas sp. D4002]